MSRTRLPRGATLVELLMGILLATVVVGLAAAHVARHQRAYDVVVSVVNLRAQLRDGSDILTADLRGSSVAGDSILVARDTAIEFYSAIGSSMLCASAPPGLISLPPDSLPSGRVMTSWVNVPEAGDNVSVFLDSSGAVPSGWKRSTITGFSSVPVSAACPASDQLLSAFDASGGNRGYRISFAPIVTGAGHRGAPVRISRRVRYSVYRGGDGAWYLGFRRCASVCGAIQPVSGPYAAASGPPLTFRYFTRTGAQLAGNGPTAEVTRVEIVLRGAFSRPIRLPGMSAPIARDSTVSSVALRNSR